MATDPAWSNVTTLLDFDDPAGDFGEIADQSAEDADWTINANALLSAGQTKFGAQSCRFNSGGELSYGVPGFPPPPTTPPTLFDVAGSFTLQMWVRADAISGTQTLIDSGGLLVTINSSGNVVLEGEDGSGSVVTVTSSGTLSATTWHYVEINRDSSGDWRVFIDGTAGAAVSETGTVTSSEIVRIGTSASGSFVGHIDDLRITDGETLNTSNYTAPTSAHPIGAVGRDLYVSASSPLGSVGPVMLHAEPVSVRVSGSSPLGIAQLSALVAEARSVDIAAPSPLGGARPLVLNDFGQLITDPVERYTLTVTADPESSVDEPLHLPISSWQATLQTERANFLQVVIPNAAPYMFDLSTRIGSQEFIVFRETTIGGINVRSEMARASLDTVQLQEGATTGTATLRGYTEAFAGSPDELRTIVLTGVRTRTQDLLATARVRCDIDWFLRPGQEVTDATIIFTADYINYFVPSEGDSYMDVGTRG
jgi:hypothetical protein